MKPLERQRLREVLKDTPPICKIHYYAHERKKVFYVEYCEPEWMKRERISLSLEAMTDFILDESIGTRYLDNRIQEMSPFFLQLNPRAWQSYSESWGRGVWIQDLGILEYKPAYDNLREVWLHDHNERISNIALEALVKLKDERTLADIRKKLNSMGSSEDDFYQALTYLRGLENFKCDRAVDIIMEFAEFLKELYPAKEIYQTTNSINETYNIGPMSDELRSVMFSLSIIGTDKAKKAIKQIRRWFPRDAMLYEAEKFIGFDRGKQEKQKPKIILSPDYTEDLAGTEYWNLSGTMRPRKHQAN